MNRNEFADTMHVRRKRSGSWANAVAILLGLMICLGWAATQAAAQTAGEGAIVGTVKDATGAVIPNAKVTATNQATNIATTRTSSSAGFYSITPLPPGTYTIRVTATDFKTLVQENLVLDALQTLGFNPVLVVGAQTQSITVTAAPPVLETENATLGLTMENADYANLPVQMASGNQRDPTAFGVLTPGAQSGPRLPNIGGTGGYLGQLYLDGMPAETVSQQGDNRLISEGMNLDAVDQFQLLTSSPPAEYMGAGAENFTMKSGGVKYHGQVSEFVRNTVFDTWCFTCKAATIKNSVGATVAAPKPWEHQNELSASVGGYVPHTGKKLFFFYAYDRYHYRAVVNPSLLTIPTPLMLAGNFTELTETAAYPTGNPVSGQTGAGANNPAWLYNPLTNSCPGTGAVCTRQPLSSGGTNNVIPSALLSPIAQAMQQWMPAPTNPGVLVNNYLGSIPTGKDNHVNNWRVDYDMSAKHRISSVGVMGTYGYLNNWGSPYLPQPYVGGDDAAIYPKDYVIGDTYTVSPNLVNQLKYSYTRFFQNIYDDTQGVTAWEVGTFGITNLPAGQAGQEFPGASFGTTAAYNSGLSGWTGGSNSTSTQLTTPNNYALTDNVQWLRGKHALTFGGTLQFENINNANPATYTGVLALSYNANSTANYGWNNTAGTTTNAISTGGTGYAGQLGATAATTGPSGFAYASYLLGAVGGTPTLGLQPVSEVGGRFLTIAPYAEDIFRVTQKLTLDIGLRWDYLPPYHEVQNRWTFLNPNITNPLTNTPGMLQFAGRWGGPGVSCMCNTPVQTYWKNYGPRVSAAYELNPKTVFRAGYAQVFSQGGGVGGRGGASGGTGQTGFNVSAIGPAESTSTASAAPSFFLNTSAGFTAAGMANASLFGAGFAYPSAPAQNVAAQELGTGFYLSTPTTMATASSVSYGDFYLAGRAPELEMYNAGFERGITQNMTLAVNYVGNESHFLLDYSGAGNADSSTSRGYWLNQLNPMYLAILGPITAQGTGGGAGGPLLNAQANATTVAQVTAAIPTAPAPTFFTKAGAVSSKATIEQMLVAFPQYTTVADTWGNSDNFSYNSLQVTLNQRLSQGLTFNVNYTFSKNIGDDTNFRSGFAIPAGAVSRSSSAWKMDRIERSWTAISIPQNLKAFGVWNLPFGQGHIGNDNRLVRWAAGGWQLSGIYNWISGTPVQVTWSGSTSATYPGQGQAVPDLNPAFGSNSARINGHYGKGPYGYNTCNLGINVIGQTGCTQIPYISVNAFAAPQNISSNSTAQYLLGNAPRTRALQLRNPYSWNVDSGLKRTFPIHENLKFVFEADCLNTWNHVTFGGPSAGWAAGSTAFGTIGSASGNRDWQFAGHITF
jgi:hypothetical protein